MCVREKEKERDYVCVSEIETQTDRPSEKER